MRYDQIKAEQEEGQQQKTRLLMASEKLFFLIPFFGAMVLRAKSSCSSTCGRCWAEWYFFCVDKQLLQTWYGAPPVMSSGLTGI